MDLPIQRDYLKEISSLKEDRIAQAQEIARLYKHIDDIETRNLLLMEFLNDVSPQKTEDFIADE